MDDPALVLSIGTIVGGRTAANKPWREALTRLGQSVAEAREGVSSPVNVNVVFHIPGNFLKPEFEGTRTGSYRKADSLLMVQVAVPESPVADYYGWALDALRKAVGTAEDWARRRKVATELPSLYAIVSQLEASVRDDGGDTPNFS